MIIEEEISEIEEYLDVKIYKRDREKDIEEEEDKNEKSKQKEYEEFDVCEENYEKIENYLTEKFNFKSDESFHLQMIEKINDPNTNQKDINLMLNLIDAYNSIHN